MREKSKKTQSCTTETKTQKRDRIFAVSLAVLGIATVIVSVAVFAHGESSAASYDYTIVIDAGHGGIDGGVAGTLTNVKESELNLAVAYLLKHEIEKHGFRAVMTRTDKNGLYGLKGKGFKRRDMEKRKEIILKSKANMVISIHMNEFPLSSRQGPQVFFDKNSESSRLLAESIQKALNGFTGNDHICLKGDYYILKCTSSPSVIVECGFLSNAEDERNLMKEEYQKKIATKIFEGILLYTITSGEKMVRVS